MLAWSPFTSPGPDEPQGVHRCDMSIHMSMRDCIQSKTSQLGFIHIPLILRSWPGDTHPCTHLNAASQSITGDSQEWEANCYLLRSDPSWSMSAESLSHHSGPQNK